MSRIHEALKKAAEERSSRLATDGATNFADVASDLTRTTVAERELGSPELRTAVRKVTDPSRLQFDELIQRCVQANWKIDPRNSVFHGADTKKVGAERFRTLRSRLY